MKNYIVGEYYNFWVKGLGNHRLYLEDENGDSFTVQAYDFQIDWDWSSPEVPVNVVKCYVKETTATGHVILEQCRELLLTVLYPEASRKETTICKFIVESLKTINGNLYYVVNDVFGLSHMFKPSTEQRQYQPGDEVELCVTEIHKKENNRTYLKLQEVQSDIPQTIIPTTSKHVDNDTYVGEFGEESDKVEFKSTIVYPAGATSADIDTQMRVILRTIAGFMNAKGGTLYIGVDDAGDAIGIEKEYAMLNTSSRDQNEYQQNRDGYENKLRSGINYLLGPVAQDYVSIKFSNHSGHTVCAVEINPSNTVVWYDEYDAYKRMGNRTTHLRSLAIEKLVLDKMSLSRPAILQSRPIAVQTEDEILAPAVIVDAEPSTEPTVIKRPKPSTITAIGETKIGNGSFYMNLFTNGEWSWSKNIPKDSDLEFCIPINSPASKNDLIMVYEDGCVNRVDAYHLHLSFKNENRRYMNGRRNDRVKLVKVFHAQADDLLACISIQNGHEFVKVHPVDHVSRHDLMKSKGVRLINTSGMTGVSKAEICFISATHAQRVSSFMKTVNQKAGSLGLQMDLPKNAKFLQARDTLLALCDIPTITAQTV